MRILMLLEKEFPHDERAEKEIHTLLDQGHEVHLACTTRINRPALELYKGFTIHRMKLKKLMYKLSAAVLVLPFYLKAWRRFTRDILREFRFDVIHVHDLPLSSIAINLKRKTSISFVSDQHEYYSNWIVETAHYNSTAGKIIGLLSDWKKYEEKSLRMADLVITVEKPLQEQYIEEYRLSRDKIIILPNTPDKKIFHRSNVDQRLFQKYREPFTLLYFGGIDVLRGLDNVITAIPGIADAIPDFKFVVAGRITQRYNPLRTAEKYGVEEYVDFLGWVDIKELPSLIHVSDLGVFIPPSNRLEINKTIATKNYQFLVMNKPVMVGNAAYMKEFTETNRIGFSVDENDPRDIAMKIKEFAQNQDLRSEMERNCSKIRDNYYWEVTSKQFVIKYNQLEMTE